MNFRTVFFFLVFEVPPDFFSLTSVLMTWDGTLETGQDPEHDDEDPGGEENQGLARDAGHQADQQTS